MSDHSEMKQYIEQRLARGLDTPELDGAEVLALINELERVKALNHHQFGDAIRKNSEIKRLKIKMETVRYLLGSLVPSDKSLDIVIDAAIRFGERP